MGELLIVNQSRWWACNVNQTQLLPNNSG